MSTTPSVYSSYAFSTTSPSASQSSLSDHPYPPTTVPQLPSQPQPQQPAPKKKSHAKKTPPGHVPRPRNAFIIFRCDFVQNKHVPPEVENDHRIISRIAGKVWAEMPKSEKKKWEAIALKEAEEHRRKYPSYRYTPLPKPEDMAAHRTTCKKVAAPKKQRAMKQVVFDDSDVNRCNEVASLLARGYRGDQLAKAVRTIKRKASSSTTTGTTMGAVGSSVPGSSTLGACPIFRSPLMSAPDACGSGGAGVGESQILQPRALYPGHSSHFVPSILRDPYISPRATLSSTTRAPSMVLPKPEPPTDQWDSLRSCFMPTLEYAPQFPPPLLPSYHGNDFAPYGGGYVQSTNCGYTEIPIGGSHHHIPTGGNWISEQPLPHPTSHHHHHQPFIAPSNFEHGMPMPYTLENDPWAPPPLRDVTDELADFFNSSV